jgi:hypothetical protein
MRRTSAGWLKERVARSKQGQAPPSTIGQEIPVVVSLPSTLSAPATMPIERRPIPAPAPIELDLGHRYEDRGLLGRGGMGAVRRMRDLTLRREVAVKTLGPGLTRPDQAQAFVEEAQVTAQLEHPNIVPVHELGTDRRGSVYFAMMMVRGRTLHELLLDPTRPPGSSERLAMALEVFLKVCDAMAFAHSRGVLHLDIKPANVMVGAYGEVYLMDWGLARVLHDRPGAVDVPTAPPSEMGGVVGTPEYMSPEMARGGTKVDERTDVFGLGALLYEIVTGRAPYDATPDADAMTRARAHSFTFPDEFEDVQVPSKLAKVIAKAMVRDPADRYASAREIAEQVREFLHRGLHLPRWTFAPGTCIVREGERGECAFIVVRGRCDAFKVVDGVKKVLRTMGPGSMFGELALVSSLPRTASVEAVTDATVLILTRDLVDRGLPPDTWEGLLVRTLVDRFRDLDAKLTEAERRLSERPGAG